eukprot:3007277-Pyramimonas_sp.AAC.1
MLFRVCRGGEAGLPGTLGDSRGKLGVWRPRYAVVFVEGEGAGFPGTLASGILGESQDNSGSGGRGMQGGLAR